MITPIKRRALHRSKIIEGQFKALLKNIEADNYCVDIMTQSLAIQKSLASLNKLVLENHLQTCAKDQLTSTNPADNDKAIAELLQLYELGNVRGKL
jgi:DNA-binding FrmR family transcriptional regulator